MVTAYPNDQIYAFYSVLAMTHRQADVIFDEHIERGDLSRYKYLVLPKCDVITETMHEQIRDFIRRGGLVIADQYLGASIPEAVKVDFDFTYRTKVNADAISTGVMYAEWHDQLQPNTAALAKAKGVTAEEDQKLLDSYAAQLDKKLAAWPVTTRIDTPHVLVNELEHHGVRYLALINDHRAYDDRTGPYKATLDALRPIKATVSVAADVPLHPHDLVRGTALPVRQMAGRLEFEVELDSLGGTLIALYPTSIDRVTITTPGPVALGGTASVEIAVVDATGRPVPGLQPLQLTVSDPTGKPADGTGPCVAENGRLIVPITPGITDTVGTWSIQVEERSRRRKAQAILNVNPSAP